MLRARTAKARATIPHAPCELLLLKKKQLYKKYSCISHKPQRASLVGLGEALVLTLVTHALVTRAQGASKDLVSSGSLMS